MTQIPAEQPEETPDGAQDAVYAPEEEDQLQPEDTLVDRGVDDALDEGFTTPEGWSPASSGSAYGNTRAEVAAGENLDQRLAQEVPEPDPYAEAAEEVAEEEVGGEVGTARSGRLVAEDQGLGPDEDAELSASDVGIDGAAASAEEAAVHEIDDLP
ncbi:DUF5709 domain-containing protein [Nocardioides sp.]|uniref:DUF5709 domain-containing protein n=1 Tax=Nocardioides sp. TaxID=35761 RepID=UPI00273291DA|nr:DUF5709 domain-containing protein [Nocardioides sp.]MDP3890460.1 DUF5709 domain-containing protein [Nocardioides sp.]